MFNNSTIFAEENQTDQTQYSSESQFCSFLQQVQKGSDISFPDFRAVSIFIAIANALLALFAILGNIVTIAAFSRCVQLRTPSNLLLLGLSVCDLLVGLVTQPVFTAEVALVAANSDVACHLKDLYVIFLFSFSSSSVMHVCLISVERSFAIMFPFKHEHLVTTKRVQFLLVVFWIFWALVTVFTRRNHGAGIIGYSRIAFIVFSALVVLVLNIRLWIEARRHSRKIESSTGNPNTSTNEENCTRAQRKSLRDSKAAKTVLLIIGFMVTCNLPLIATFTARKFYNLRGRVMTLLWFASNTVLLMPAILNPGVYFWRKKDFRISVKRMFGWQNAVVAQH
ncbi:trace amine-associated receptor 13c-like [Stylophora pistillata]|uniref:trace amine-associated receptor 13c-like n=1 Tax=Stylophora pistillata TaxID=50429 RepID=UPI000C04FF35|nr:trace amine-associated receptor 13c-like [Stylophora pistillata]